MRTANSIEELKAITEYTKDSELSPVDSATNDAQVSASKPVGRAASIQAIRPYCFKPGQSGNPGGKPKDSAKEIARQAFENNEDAIYNAMTGALLKGNAYAFTQLADRAYGKLKEKVEHSGSVGLADFLREARDE